MRRWFNNLYYSFPIQLLVFHLRSNHLLLLLWIILLLFISGDLALKLGAQYLFLDPEYLGKVNFWSFIFLGFAYGGFLMSWNLTTYLLSAHQFTFLATLSRPFTKFSLNNIILPLLVFLFYIIQIINFQNGAFSTYEIFLNCLGFLFGGFSLILCYSIYFHFTNRDINYYKKRNKPPPNLIREIAPGRRNVDLSYIKQDSSRWKVTTFLNESFQPRLVRSVAHYDSKLLSNIFKQNHLNALLIQLLSMLFLIGLGQLINTPVFRIPAGASILIMMSILIATIGALTYWFNEWRTLVMVLSLILINYITSLGFFIHPNKAYGLNYENPSAVYHLDSLQEICFSDQVNKDIQATEEILTNWKRKLSEKDPDSTELFSSESERPKMVLLAVSGGGLKSALWTIQVLQQADSVLQGDLLDHTVLISGASGGLMGAAYLREVMLQKQYNPTINIYSPQYRKHISKDILNSIAFSIITKDLFVPQKILNDDQQPYSIDRGYVFEQQFNENTNTLLDKELSDYKLPEQQALIPMLFFTPTIINDARRLMISPQGVTYMMTSPIGTKEKDIVEIDAVDFGWLFRNHDAQNLKFLSALRMSATYPYVLPTVHLPSEPEIKVLDAGILDNFGLFSTVRFIHVFKDWIKKHTSGVIIVQISSSEKYEPIQSVGPNGIISSLIKPIGIASKLFEFQEFNYDNDIGLLFEILGPKNFDVVRFICEAPQNMQQDAAISFHLTEKEKQTVQKAFLFESNQQSLKKLNALLNSTQQDEVLGSAIQ